MSILGDNIKMQLVARSLFSFSKIGFIGLGNMGFPMALNLTKKGHQVFAFDVDASKAEEATKNNITFRTEVKQVAKDANIFVTMLPNSEHSQSVCLAEGGTSILTQVSSKTQLQGPSSSTAAQLLLLWP